MMQQPHHHHPHFLSQVRQPTILRLLAIAGAFVSGCAILFVFSRSGSADPPPRPNLHRPLSASAANYTCYVDLDLLRSHGYNGSVEYSRLEIAVTPTANFTGFSDALDLKFPNSEPLALSADDEAARAPLPDGRCATTLTIPGPPARPPPDASHMTFGVSTSLERLHESLDAFAHWAAGTNTRIIALTDEGASFTDKVRKKAERLGVRLTLIEADDERLDRYFTLIQILYEQREEATQWAVLIDDDTFFPSMRNLVDRFATYDASQPLYVGGVTEDPHQLYMGSFMGYGGAGIFLSMPLLTQIYAEFDECYDFKGAGDRMVARCIQAHTTTKLTWDRDLHQLDLRDDASGFYESGRPLPLSVHHWKSWHAANMVGLGRVARICGDDCLLRRWRLADGWYLINGYSVVRYSEGTDEDTLVGMEHTWLDSKYDGWDPFGYSLGPVRKKDEGKVSYRLVDAVEVGDEVRQIYVHEPGEEPPRVLEIVWKGG